MKLFYLNFIKKKWNSSRKRVCGHIGSLQCHIEMEHELRDAHIVTVRFISFVSCDIYVT